MQETFVNNTNKNNNNKNNYINIYKIHTHIIGMFIIRNREC